LHFTLLEHLHVQSRPWLKCLNGNLLSTLGLKEVNDSSRALSELPIVKVVLIVNIDTFSVNAKVPFLGLRLAIRLKRDRCFLPIKLTQFGSLNDLV
jgi:hypothetical protein